MSQSLTYPSNKLLSLTNVTPWNIYLLELLFAFPDMGVAIRSGVPLMLNEPTMDDRFKNSNTRKYAFKQDGVTLDGNSRKDFLSAITTYEKLDARRKDEEARACALITSSFSEEAKMQLRTNAAYILAANSNNSFQMYTVAKAAHTRATSFAVAQHSFLQLLKLKMTTTFTDYVDRLLAQKDAFTAIFDPEGTGMMAIENIITMVLINGLPDEFKYMKDLMFSKDLMGKIPDFKETLQAMMTYDLNKQKVEDSSTIVVPPRPTILTATSTVWLKAECGICHKELNVIRAIWKLDKLKNLLMSTQLLLKSPVPRQLDSGATFSCTNEISDNFRSFLIRFLVLMEPSILRPSFCCQTCQPRSTVHSWLYSAHRQDQIYCCRWL